MSPPCHGCKYRRSFTPWVCTNSALVDRNAMDAVSDVLTSLRLEGALYINAEFTAPWCVQAKFGLGSVRARLAGAEDVLFFHFVMEGRCKVRLADSAESLDVAAGDLVLFLNEDKHLMGS